jgi:hypothetical protein
MQFSQNQKQQQDYAAWYTFVETPCLKREAERQKAAKAAASAKPQDSPKLVEKDTSFFDTVLGWCVTVAVFYVIWTILRIYYYLWGLGTAVLEDLTAFFPFL